ncbi:MAG: DUF4388 domain-containing protein [Chloroflexota bacterium]|nr:DUF4388 domain-containing protein [Chloroflexota bacterium]
MLHSTPSGEPWQGSLSDLPNVVASIKRLRAFGRLTLRNSARLGVAHLYFRNGRLVHVVGTRGATNAVLADLQGWMRGTLRFERGVSIDHDTVADEQEQFFERWLAQLRGRSATPPPPSRSHIVEGQAVATPRVDQLIVPWEWRVLIEGTRRVTLAVAHLVGPQEALTVLRDILDDCSSAFPAFAGMQIASGGYLHVKDNSQLDRLPREALLEGFAALIATCQYFCSPIIGELEAHRLVIQALGDLGPTLISLGVFRIDDRLLLNRG